jgi:hypothetical protein
MPLQMYGLDALSADKGRILFVCEGPFDALALETHLCAVKKRKLFDVLAVPSANVFREKWLKYLKGRTVRLVFDNDEAGRKGQERIAKLVRDKRVPCKVTALDWPAEPPVKDVENLIRAGVRAVDFTHRHCKLAATGLRPIPFVRGDQIPEEKAAWLWKLHIRFGTLVSFSGQMGTHKSAVAKYLAAMATAGKPMPLCETALPPFDVIFFTSEDSAARVKDLVRLYGGDLKRLHVHDIVTTEEPIDVLEYLPEIEANLIAKGARLLILDAMNSFVGGDITSDAKQRRTLSNRLLSLARRTGACILGLRNLGRVDTGKGSNNSLGGISVAHAGRCALNTLALPPRNPKDKKELPRFALEFEKVTGAPPQPPVV